MKINFCKLAGLWYIILPDYPDDAGNLELIAGADKMCDILDIDCDGLIQTIIRDIPFPKDKQGKNFTLNVIKPEHNGMNYNCPELNLDVWISEVTKYIFGRFPNTIYIKLI